MDPAKIPFNTIFTKASSCLAGPHDDVVRPAHVQLLDYEIELGLVMKRSVTKARAITPDNLHEVLAGVTIVNDVSARDVQLPQMQFYKGKSYRSFGPAGPVLLLLDASEWKRWPELRMRLSVNGKVRQETLCGDMLFAPHQTLSELSALQDLHAGDLIAEYVLAMKQGIGLNKILGTIHIYPTLAEANKYVAGNWKKAHAPQKLLAWVERFHGWRRG